MILLEGKKVATEIKENLKKYFSPAEFRDSYVGIILLGDDKASAVYVQMKKKFGEEVGVNVKIFGNCMQEQADFPNERHWFQNKNFYEIHEVLGVIQMLNADPKCLGFLVQLPLPTYLQAHKAQILARISPQKDLDGLGGKLFGLSTIDYLDFLPATPKAVLKLLSSYGFSDFTGKTVLVIGQSNLVGKPLAVELIKLGAEVVSVNEHISRDLLIQFSQHADIIVSATGQAHLVDQNFINSTKSQIFVDVGYAMKDGKPTGDMNAEALAGKVAGLSPVPGGVGPVTVACIFDNLRVLLENDEKLLGI
ncbi:MAG TPA: bifunctional 5,10-methylenetetrahydrofolate dehydrogenase/5,10-methenyltetrahydrofolate cyclohydrolase [Candidatus Absconditabacterales bacterium]|nr:bifunctional 5,10-methylenetetrahydrofolate dehydrogenase/5,10-methenyltetrahydrofolate cyclohydrolase [Candidatus Absconditabacterales bacterium]